MLAHRSPFHVRLAGRLAAILLLLAAAGLPGVLAAAAEAPQASPPNIVLVFIDDAGFADFPYFQDDHPRTPHIDQLCDEGLRFTQYYVNSPICSPSRAAYVTGQYPSRWAITSYIAARSENARRGMPDWLDPAAPSLARMLQQVGYATGHFGKWHLGGGRDVQAPPISDYGYDESLTQFEGMGDRILPLLNNYDGKPPVKFPLGIASEKLGQGNVRWVERSEATGEFVKPAIEFIRQAAAAGKPFYVNLWPDDVHTPLHPPQELRGDGSKRELYLGVLENMDAQLAELFDFIRHDEALNQNTIVIVASDNGFEPGAGAAGDLRGHKGTLYEGGFREPLIVWGPGVLDKRSAGATNDQTVISSIDVVASLAKLAGVSPPEGVVLDGEDLSPALVGAEQIKRTTPLFWVRPPDRPGGPQGENLPDLAIRSGDWKLLTEYDGSRPQLYDLAADPNEKSNLAANRPDQVAALRRDLLRWYRTAAPLDSRSPRRQFTNPIFEGADPWIIQHDGKYIACMSEGNRGIALHISDDLTKLGPKQIIWRAPRRGPYSREIWAPEIHHLDGRWYVYFAADDGDNRNHLSYVLESKGDDPLGPYEIRGPIYTGDDPEQKKDNRWAIDATVLEHEGKRYLVWSGWAADSDEQWLYIAPMKSPWELSGPRVQLCHNADYLWERVGEQPDQRGLHEGPQILKNDGRTFIIYSTSSSWQPTYKLGLLELKQGGDPLNPKDWIKAKRPVFAATEQTYGIGHASFVKSPDGKEDWIVYHAKRDRGDGWRRAVYVQPFTWGPKGRPRFGKPVAAGELLDLPSGTPEAAPDRGALNVPRFESLNGWTYFGHHQMAAIRDGALLLGSQPQDPINLYRSGEKVVFNDGDWRNLKVAAAIRILSGDRDAGILFRVRRPSIGYDAQEGYFAGIVPRTNRVILGATDGRHWRHIADAEANVADGKEHRLEVVARGPSIAVMLDGEEKLKVDDDAFPRGSIGLRVVDAEAAFANVAVEPLRRQRRSAAVIPARTNDALQPSASSDRQHPDIVLFIADDLTCSDVGPYGGPDAQTPRLDRLATESMKFNHAFAASPTCTPSRSALYTGLFPIRNGAHANHSRINDGVKTLPAYLNELGYRTVIAGKTHIGPRPQFPFEYLKNSNVRPPGVNNVLLTDLGVDAIDELLRDHDRSQPLCLIVAAHSSHVIWKKNESYDPQAIKIPPHLHDTPQLRNARVDYYTDVTQLDAEVGQVLDSLRRHGYDDALFMFTADQGAQFPFEKWNLYDAGIKVPLLIRWPGRVAPDTTTDAMVSLVDLLPTMLAAAGETPPAAIDGRSFLDVLTGKANEARQEIFAAHTGDLDMNQAPMRTIRTKQLKYIENLAPEIPFTTHISKGEGAEKYWKDWVARSDNDPAAAIVDRYEHRPAEELYDVIADPYELHNLANDPAFAEQKSKLRERLHAWRTEQGENLSKVLMPADAKRGRFPYAE